MNLLVNSYQTFHFAESVKARARLEINWRPLGVACIPVKTTDLDSSLSLNVEVGCQKQPPTA